MKNVLFISLLFVLCGCSNMDSDVYERRMVYRSFDGKHYIDHFDRDCSRIEGRVITVKFNAISRDSSPCSHFCLYCVSYSDYKEEEQKYWSSIY